MPAEEFQKFLMELDEKRKKTAEDIIEKHKLECPLYRPGDIVTIGGVEISGSAMPIITVVIKDVRPAIVSEVHGTALYCYGVKPFRDGKPASGSLAVCDGDIREGKCRPADLPRWEGSLTAIYESTFVPPKILAVAPTPTKAEMAKPEVEKVKHTAEKDDFISFRGIVDGLLGALPQKTVENFVETPEYKIYSEVMEDGKTEEARKQFVDIVDGLLGNLPQKTIEEFVASSHFKIYERVINKYKKE
jgi:hypothetical protein